MKDSNLLGLGGDLNTAVEEYLEHNCARSRDSKKFTLTLVNGADTGRPGP